MGAAAVVAEAAVWVVGLALGVVAVDVHGEVETRVHRPETGTRDFVGRGNALRMPVRPVHKVLEHSQREWMWKTFANYLKNTTQLVKKLRMLKVVKCF